MPAHRSHRRRNRFGVGLSCVAFFAATQVSVASGADREPTVSEERADFQTKIQALTKMLEGSEGWPKRAKRVVEEQFLQRAKVLLEQSNSYKYLGGPDIIPDEAMLIMQGTLKYAIEAGSKSEDWSIASEWGHPVTELLRGIEQAKLTVLHALVRSNADPIYAAHIKEKYGTHGGAFIPAQNGKLCEIIFMKQPGLDKYGEPHPATPEGMNWNLEKKGRYVSSEIAKKKADALLRSKVRGGK